MKLAMLAILVYPLTVLGFSAASIMLKTALDSLGNAGPHGLSEILYAFASTTANNGSAFAGSAAYRLVQHHALASPCFLVASPMSSRSWRFPAPSRQKRKPRRQAGTFPTHDPCHRPAAGRDPDSLSPAIFPRARACPIVEHFLMLAGKTF